MKISMLSGGIPMITSDELVDEFNRVIGSIRGEEWELNPQFITAHLPTKQPHRKTGIAQARRAAKKRKNQK